MFLTEIKGWLLSRRFRTLDLEVVFTTQEDSFAHPSAGGLRFRLTCWRYTPPGATISSKFEISCWDSIVSFRQFGLLFLFCSPNPNHMIWPSCGGYIYRNAEWKHAHALSNTGIFNKRHNATHVAKTMTKWNLFRSAQLQLDIHREGGLELQLDDNVSSKRPMRVSRPSQGCLHPAPLLIAA